MKNNEYSQPPNPHRLYRSANKTICGVCAGFAEYLNLDTTLVRLLWIVSFFLVGPISFIAYFVACVMMPMRTVAEQSEMRPEEDAFWRGVERRPATTFSNLRYQFRDLEERLAGLERSVTSKEWKLRQQFRDLEN